MDFNLNERKLKILEAIIRDYICTGEPIGSRTIAKKYDLGISSATVRNEMSDLEDMGYIEQLHTSSGRRPSDKGYRLYVDRLLEIPKLSLEQELKIKDELINEALYEVDKIVKKSILLLSELTKLTCVVKMPSARNSRIKLIQLMNIDNNNILVTVITQNGLITNNIIRVSKPIDNDIIEKISKVLNSKLNNLTIQDINLKVINDIKNYLNKYEAIFDAIITVLYETLSKDGNSEIYCEGTANIFNYVEYNDIEKAKQFLSLIDNKQIMCKLFDDAICGEHENNNVHISIGKENFITDAQDCSVVSTIYSLGNKPLGSIGVIGPTRIPYSRVISVLTQFAETLNENINKIYFGDDER
ncbi:heat-inducible transcriptional repressor HrcA [Clostridium aestuarii]|uniref:Heat-inducible transcription repressor HrcA n=1 Tax=Clostridium aestuarii TaxID=338193 RepID=A0ABT4CZ58_9CLOT|nr:heat-inducible transcriptional repressor HrcA [Clostridium aestuarii]MCY6484260.1 heat-inducible transcriptional repressor HrcA [Clostridium aestuarii]